MLGIIIAIIVAFIWSIGEVDYSKIAKKYNHTNVYLYTFFLRCIIYLGVVLIFKRALFGTFNINAFKAILPIIFFDLFASLVVNIAEYNGKLSVTSPIMASYPVVDILLGIILLKEKTSHLDLFLVLCISISIIILAINPSKDKKAPNPKKGILFSVLYMLLVSFSSYFEKSAYQGAYTIFDLYYYKGLIYTLASIFFFTNLILTSTKINKPSKDMIKGCGLTPIGNVAYSYALTLNNISIIAPISSLYTVITHYISRKYLKEKIDKKEKIGIYVILISTIILIIHSIMG